MLKYTLPEVSEKDYPEEAMNTSYPEWLYLPVSKEQAGSVKVGDEVEITVKGKVKSVSVRENELKESGNIDIILKEVIMAEANEFAKMADEMEEDD